MNLTKHSLSRLDSTPRSYYKPLRVELAVEGLYKGGLHTTTHPKKGELLQAPPGGSHIPPVNVLSLHHNFCKGRLILNLKLCVKHKGTGKGPGQVAQLVIPYTKRLHARSPVRAHASVAGSISSRGTCRRPLINVSLSHQFLSF